MKTGELKRQIEYLLETKNLKKIQELLAHIHPADIADLIDSIVDEEKRKLTSIVDLLQKTRSLSRKHFRDLLK